MNNARSLIVGGEQGVARGWVEPLRAAGANITVVSDGQSALRHLDLLGPELVIIDLQLSGSLDGYDTCRAIRSRTEACIVIVSSTSGPYEEVVALAVGADHFVPIGTPEEVVIARLRSLIRRARGMVLVPGHPDHEFVPGRAEPSLGAARSRNGSVPTAAATGIGSTRLDRAGNGRTLLASGSGPEGPDGCLMDGDLEIDLAAREVLVRGRPVALTRIEFDLLVALTRNPRRVLTRDQLMASAWEVPFDGSHVLDAHLSRLRGKVAEAGGDRVAHAVRGVGFRLRA